jgi:antitoxin (DNA-binding transcriptional repressor) of toxin-antitoxin stability system
MKAAAFLFRLYDSVQNSMEATMKLSISEVRKQLPSLVRQVQQDAGASVLITVHDEVVAELRAVQTEPEPGAAAKKLLRLMKRLPKPRGPKTHVSSHIKAHLYGNGSVAP